MSGSVVCIEVMDALLHQCIMTMIVRIYGSLATQWISGGQLRIMQRVLDGEPFHLGLDASCQDDREDSLVSDHRLR
jgi:hypothetical protein